MLAILNVIYVLVAIAMIALILMQRGAGAAAGSGFGAGASATVFGSTGAGNFLSKATKWLAITFFVISLYMAWYATNSAMPRAGAPDLGVMADVPAVPADAAPQVPAAPTVPAAPVEQAPDEELPVGEAPAGEATPPVEEPVPAG